MTTPSVALCVSCALLASAAGQVDAAVIHDIVTWSEADGGNGHSYRAVFAPELMSWTEAKAMSESLGGHLATLTSAAEASFVFSAVARPEQWWTDGGPWLGGYQDTSAPDYSEPTGGWRWVTGEAWSFTHWGNGEPNNVGPENYLHYLDTGGSPVPTWNDQSDGRRQRGFIMEFPVPAPGAMSLLCCAACIRRRKR